MVHASSPGATIEVRSAFTLKASMSRQTAKCCCVVAFQRAARLSPVKMKEADMWKVCVARRVRVWSPGAVDVVVTAALEELSLLNLRLLARHLCCVRGLRALRPRAVLHCGAATGEGAMVFRWLGRKKDNQGQLERREPPPLKVPEAPDRIYKAGDVIGGEWLVRRVMEGGLGIVYVVELRRNSEVLCVLKAPKRQSNPAVRENFRTEAETWVRLGDHPNIVRAQGVDELAGQLYVVAELVEGDQLGRVSLRDYLNFGPLSPRAIAAWTADFCYGLDYARSKGLVAHRDIKPENLLVGRDGILRITDFGIARAMALDAKNVEAEQAKLGEWQTRGGKVAGTPPYMAPEQWMGGKQDLRTDIYAFGVTMYEMHYGRQPFGGANIADIAEQHLSLEPQIPKGMFAEVIARCLVKSPNARFGEPMALLQAISDLCGDNGIPLPPKPRAVGEKAKELLALTHLGHSGKGKKPL
jgi:hypothetical protein